MTKPKLAPGSHLLRKCHARPSGSSLQGKLTSDQQRKRPAVGPQGGAEAASGKLPVRRGSLCPAQGSAAAEVLCPGTGSGQTAPRSREFLRKGPSKVSSPQEREHGDTSQAEPELRPRPCGTLGECTEDTGQGPLPGTRSLSEMSLYRHKQHRKHSIVMGSR